MTQPLHDEEQDPEAYAGVPVPDPWDLVDGTGDNYGWPTLVRGGDDGSLDSGSLPAEPQG